MKNPNQQLITLDFYLKRYMQFIEEERSCLASNYRNILLRTCGQIRPSLRETSIQSITPEMIAEEMEYYIRLSKGYAESALTIFRWCFQKAYDERIITINPMVYVHLKERRHYTYVINDDIYMRIHKAFYTVPGGKAIGLLAWLDLPLKAIDQIIYEKCDADLHIIHFYHSGKQRMKTLIHPDAILLLQSAIEDYSKKMQNPEVNVRNSSHYLFFSKYGSLYNERQLWFISRAVFEKAGADDVTYLQLRHKLRMKCL